MSAGVVDFSRIMGTAFSGEVSGPAWHPTQARCSPPRIQKNPASRFKVFPAVSSSSICNGCSVGTCTKKDPSRSTGAVPSSSDCPRHRACRSAPNESTLWRTDISKCRHSGKADSRSASRAGPRDDGWASGAPPAESAEERRRFVRLLPGAARRARIPQHQLKWRLRVRRQDKSQSPAGVSTTSPAYSPAGAEIRLPAPAPK